jgi:hypothetical protein
MVDMGMADHQNKEAESKQIECKIEI